MAVAEAPGVSVGYGQYKVEAKGLYGLIFLLVVTLIVGAAGIQWQLYQSLKAEIRTVQTELKIMSYVISQPEDKRPKLLMPSEMRTRIEQ